MRVALSMPTVSSVGECMIKQRLVQVGHVRHQPVLGDVVEEIARDVERPAGQRDLDLAMLADVFDTILEQSRDMGGIGGCGDGDDGLGFRNLPGGSENGGAAEAVADQDRWGLPGLAQMIGGAHEIGDVGGEVGIGEIAFAGAQSCEIEPQHRDAFCGKRHRDAFGSKHVLAAGEAMREQRIGDRFGLRQVE